MSVLIRIVLIGLTGASLLMSRAHADFDSAMTALKRGDFATALKDLQPLAERGDASAQHWLAVSYFSYPVTMQGDPLLAVQWYRRAAEQGYAPSQVHLGALYELGAGVTQDVAQAAAWYRRAASQGNAMALFNLALLYEAGHGVPRDPVLGAVLLHLFERSGDTITARGKLASLNKILSSEQRQEIEAVVSAWKPGMPLPAESRTGQVP